ncbi:glycosyltransferase family 4 protein, partial [Pseudomonadota bacterium]|nr:glycosyltransferase family 4 protein [Pseudomonadota bacterium]
MKLLRLTPALKATSSSYNQFSLGFKESIDQTIGSLHKHEVSIDEKITVFHGDGSALKMLKQIKRFIHQIEYDVIHIHNGVTGIIFILAIFPFKIGLLKKTVFTLHNSWNVLKTRNKFFNLIVMLLSSKVCTCG